MTNLQPSILVEFRTRVPINDESWDYFTLQGTVTSRGNGSSVSIDVESESFIQGECTSAIVDSFMTELTQRVKEGFGV